MMTIRCDVGIHSLCSKPDCSCQCHAGTPTDPPLTPAQRACAVLLALAVIAGGFVDGGAL